MVYNIKQTASMPFKMIESRANEESDFFDEPFKLKLIKKTNTTGLDLIETNNCELDEDLVLEKLSKVLEQLGFNPKHIGFHFLAYASFLCYKNKLTIKNLTKTIYVSVARQFLTNISCVERNIRSAVSNAKVILSKKFKLNKDIRLTNKHVIYKLSTLIKRFVF